MPRPKLPQLNCAHGAPMGRPPWPRSSWVSPYLDPTQTQNFKLPAWCFRLRLTGGGCYDEGGAYWGSPETVWCATNGFDDDDNNFQLFTRASNRNGAIAKFEAMAPGLITWKKKAKTQ